MDKKYRRLLNSASENLRKAEKKFYDGTEKTKRAKKEVDIVLRETSGESYLNKSRKLDMADSEEFMDEPKLKEA